jgi:hypothetical protein
MSTTRLAAQHQETAACCAHIQALVQESTALCCVTTKYIAAVRQTVADTRRIIENSQRVGAAVRQTVADTCRIIENSQRVGAAAFELAQRIALPSQLLAALPGSSPEGTVLPGLTINRLSPFPAFLS